MLVISVVAFSIRDELGDPLRELVGESMSEEVRYELHDRMRLNDPLAVQYWRFLKKTASGEFGNSYFFKKPALEVIAAKFVATFELVLAAALIIVLVSVPAGVWCALHPKSALNASQVACHAVKEGRI